MTGYRSYSHSVQFFRPVKAIERTDEANSMAFLQREFLPSNDTYKTKSSAGNTLNFIRGNENVTHSAQGETVFLGGNFLFRISEYTQRERKCSFRKLQIFISQTTDSHFANYRFPFRKLQFPFRFVPFRFTITDIFAFATEMKGTKLNEEDILVSFDVSPLFTDVPSQFLPRKRLTKTGLMKPTT